MEELKKVCIYHFTNAENLRRPIVNEKQMAILNEFASQYGDIKQVYLDGTLKQCNQDANSGSSDHAFRYELIRFSGCN